MLMCEEFLLLVTSPEGKWLAASNAVPLALAGGLLAELALQGKVTVDDRQRIAVVDRSLPDDLVLADALSAFAGGEGKKPGTVLGTVARGLGDKLYARLIEAGVVEVRKVRLLPVRHFPLRDPAVRQRTWDEVAAVLRGDRSPEPRTGTLLGLVVASGALSRVFPPADFGLSRRELENRARQLAQGDWATDAVGQAVRAAQAATMAAVTAAVTASSVAASGSG
ncbi:MAG TPA: GPP34 family phosphoprotein [Streptosporangiaceae bacterium]|nr:GPP34 family phosphoprotein [Streptosporangiaceae bacterium]